MPQAPLDRDGIEAALDLVRAANDGDVELATLLSIGFAVAMTWNGRSSW